MTPITFDRFVRGLIVLAAVVLGGIAFGYLSGVLIPFLAAGVVAYLLNPVVNFLQYTCKLRLRALCVLLSLALAIGVVTGLLWLCIPPMIEECGHLENVIRHYLEGGRENTTIPTGVRQFFDTHFRESELNDYLQSGNLQDALRDLLPRLWNLLSSAAGVFVSVVAWLISLLYLFFLMLDYDRYARSWITYVPRRHRPLARQVASDVTYYLCGYFRGQLGIALSNCVLFTVGFLLVGFPMPLALGCFIGIISFVPYLQVAGLLPAVFLALLRAADTGQNFWVLIGSVLLVYIVVQIIQDVIVTPRIMGKIMGLSPAIILLSLSIGSYLFGIIGLILALPVTTLAQTYYKRYVVRDPQPSAPAAAEALPGDGAEE